MVEYMNLQHTVRYRSIIVASIANDDTRAKLDRAIKKLIKFEEKHMSRV